ncbi:uncharacterized protein LOC127663200 [Xyrauchen texanus]|uniref:uncharacterized protein LOC127663200 n=1 Tax=Xyrauchen texanus TaxID=154827 RepID=UPI002241CD68|nr:uncharacterized protein LOC127663200 [Xyrauchen texanus]
MCVLVLLTCIVLGAFNAQAKVVTNFRECNRFFYKQTEPRGMDQNAKKICQTLEYADSYYATLYSVSHRIPLYSAYIFDPKCSDTSGRTDKWHIEPQISGYSTEHMVLEKDSDKNIIKVKQAISDDYLDTGYDRGHLNPNSFQCDDGRKATFTLTNVAPMDACFNRIHWKNWESTLRSFLKSSPYYIATAYIVTGTVPDANVRIPQTGTSENPERVTVPSHIWTAVCYKHRIDDSYSFSFAYMGNNQPVASINLMTVSNLNNRLSGLYSQPITIFADDCHEDNNKFQVKVQVKFAKLINLPVNQGVQKLSDVQITFSAVKRARETISLEGPVNVIMMTAELGFNTLSAYFTGTEELKLFTGSACLITNSKNTNGKNTVHDELRKRDVSKGSDSVECLLVPEKQNTAADGSHCSSISDNTYSCLCIIGGTTKQCCSSPCLYQDKRKSYWCYSGKEQIPCSPRYSLITAKGDRCKDDHPCATYGEDYYWCQKISGSWDYCSPPLWRSKAKDGKYCRSNHACAKYGKGYQWCYTDDDGHYDKCCTSDDCFSAVNGKTCRSDHPCGKHGKRYLWCYITNGNWDYCCTDCSQ